MPSSQYRPPGFDWFYEQRPIIYVILGVVGILGGIALHDPLLKKIAVGSAAVLFFIAWRVHEWRKEYRK